MNTAIDHWNPSVTSKTDSINIIVIGAGPVGVRFVDELKRRQLNCQVTLFGNEPYEPYNRVQLSNLLSRSKDYSDIVTQLPLPEDQFSFVYQQQHIDKVLPEEKQVVTRQGKIFDYDKLVIATGSQPHVPTIEGADLKGVYTFRNMRDTESLLARNYRSRKIVVVGGGLLGLEAAKALSKHSTEVVLVQQADRLMNRQLDEAASIALEGFVTGLGINVMTSSGVRKVIGQGGEQGRVTGVVTRDGGVIDCDTVLFCTGIRPETKLATDAGINIGRGITVDDQLNTSIDDIYAIGECCEHNGMVYGIVSPGLEQASVLAERFSGGKATYHGTQLISSLKVVGKSVCSMGEVAEVTRRAKQELLSYQDKKTGDYRKLVIHQGRIIGACAIGEWPENRRIQEAFLANTYVYPWQRWWFSLSGQLWLGNGESKVSSWSETAVVCQCNQINRGFISNAIANGCESVASIGKETGAGTVCGSCQPLLQNLLGNKANPIAVTGAMAILVMSVIAAIAGLLLFFMPGIQPVDSVQKASLEFLWTDSYWKQVSGFSLVGLVGIGLFMSLRKRAGWTFLGNFSYWRILHVVLGVLALGVLLVHTGAHLGENLNRWLMLNFLLISVVGALAGITLSWASKASGSTVQTLKKSWYWVHLLVVWPLPALLIVHILSVYYF